MNTLTIIVWLSSFFACNDPLEAKTDSFISLHPAITETIFHLSAEASLVGRSDYCLYPKDANSLATFGTSITPNVEQLALHSGSTLLVDKSYADTHNISSMMKVVELGWQTPIDMKGSVKQLGELFNKEDQANTLIEQLDEVFVPAPSDAPRVLFLMMGSDFGSGQIWYLKPNSIHGAMLEAAGYRNAMNRTDGPPQMSIEEMLKVDPDFILLLGDDSQADIADPQKQELYKIHGLRAASTGQIKSLTYENAYGTGPAVLTNIVKIQQSLTGN